MKKMLRKCKGFMIMAVILLLLVAMSGCGGGTDTASNESSETVTAEQVETEPAVSQEFQNALRTAQNYSDNMYMSKEGLREQLTSEYGEKFDEDAADYAVENVKADWNENAYKKALTYYKDMAMSKSAVYDQLVSEYGERFTEEQAQYAVDHLED